MPLADSRAVEAVPETRYAQSGDVHIAYQVVGDGPFDLVFSPSPVSNVEVSWEWPPFARFLRRLASFSRLILFDKRGTGLSDRVTDAATLEERMDDVRAVMDAAGSEQAALFGSSEGGPMALLFAATYPERVSALVLYGSYAKSMNSDDYSAGVDPEIFEIGMQLMLEQWGSGALIDVFSPSVREDREFLEWWGRYERQSASPGAAVAIQRLNAKLDVRPVLTAISAPTLIVYRAGEFVAHVGGSKYLAEHIPGAKFVELPGNDYHPYVGDQDAILDPIEEFLTGRPARAATRTFLANVVAVGALDPAVVEPIAAAHGGQVETAATGATVLTFDGPTRAVGAALAIVDARPTVAVGGHVGEIERTGHVVRGTAVDVAIAIQQRADRGQVLISRTLNDVIPGADVVVDDIGAVNVANHTWPLFDVRHPHAASRTDRAARTGVFRRDGDVWLIGLDGRAARVRAVKGLDDIALLLARPGREVHVAELVGAADRPRDQAGAPRLDREAIASLRARLGELADDERDAEERGDAEAAAKAHAEREAIMQRVSADVGLGGRPRASDDWVERARKAVRTRIAHALKRIESAEPAVGRHLRASVRTGEFCAYEPPDTVRWQL